jgi:hypothetical protein
MSHVMMYMYIIIYVPLAAQPNSGTVSESGCRNVFNKGSSDLTSALSLYNPLTVKKFSDIPPLGTGMSLTFFTVLHQLRATNARYKGKLESTL